MAISCKPSYNPGCDQPVPDQTIARIIEKIILEDTLTVSQELFEMYAQKKYLKEDRLGLPGTDVFIDMQLERIRFRNDSVAFLIIRKLYPYLSDEDSIYIRCQMRFDSTSMIKRDLLSLKNLNEIDPVFRSLSGQNRYKKYPAYYTFSRPFFFNHNKLCFVDLRWHCGVHCGDYWLILLVYRNGEWSVSDRLRYGGS
jgi:hypothetical protein